ncbi:diguanylate cyclase [Candidatus Omnitrophota bacterium]
MRLLSLALFASLSLLILNPPEQLLPYQPFLFLFLNFLVLIGAVLFGRTGLLAFGGIGILITLLRSLLISQWLTLPLILLSATIGIYYLYAFKANQRLRKVSVELGNLEEQNNILTVELGHLRQEGQALRLKLQRYIALKWLSEALSSTLSRDKIISLITAESLKLVSKSYSSFLYLIMPEKQELSLAGVQFISEAAALASGVEPAWAKQKAADLFDHWVFKQRVPLLVADTKKDFRFNISAQAEALGGMRSLISVPLVRKNRLLGILRLENIKPDSYSVDDLRLLNIISDLAAVAVENALLYQETQKLAITDGLTELFLHRYFQERFDQEIARALWTNSGFALLMVDIDNFKSYNDTYGHIAGDIILKQIAGLIRDAVNPGDIVARYGGEEFAMLLVDSSPAEAKRLAEEIRVKVEQKRFILRREESRVTICGGLAFFPGESRVKENLIQLADRELYRAKSQGKNKICSS